MSLAWLCHFLVEKNSNLKRRLFWITHFIRHFLSLIEIFARYCRQHCHTCQHTEMLRSHSTCLLSFIMQMPAHIPHILLLYASPSSLCVFIVITSNCWQSERSNFSFDAIEMLRREREREKGRIMRAKNLNYTFWQWVIDECVAKTHTHSHTYESMLIRAGWLRNLQLLFVRQSFVTFSLLWKSYLTVRREFTLKFGHFANR
jgi:hypothetical protein